jgi:hypothetical protein
MDEPCGEKMQGMIKDGKKMCKHSQNHPQWSWEKAHLIHASKCQLQYAEYHPVDHGV